MFQLTPRCHGVAAGNSSMLPGPGGCEVLAETLQTLYGYNQWATERVLDAAALVTTDQLNAPGSAGHGSVRETLLHLIATQRGWLSWWNGSLSAAEGYLLTLDPSDYPDLAAVQGIWEQVQRDTETFVAGLSDADAAREYSETLPGGVSFRMPLWKMMLHVANHGTQHRSEAAAMLTEFGQSPGNLDMLFYIWQPGGPQAG
jgi:uncharacterized damage-inducible protein DinB